MHVEQLSTHFTGDRNLLAGLRRVLARADEAVLCVAFASQGGVHLLRDEFAAVSKREGALLLVTTTFGTTTAAGLQLARDLGVSVRVMNPTGGTYHPKVYVARSDDRVDAVVGSANLTNGLVANVEMATKLSGEMREPELARTLAWARDLWSAPSVLPWDGAGAPVADEQLEPVLWQAVAALVEQDPVIRTLGNGAANRVVEVTPRGLFVETTRSADRRSPPQLVPAWMIQLAWDYLRAHGTLTNKYLLADDGLNVKRSSFVCGLLARLPRVQPLPDVVGVRMQADP